MLNIKNKLRQFKLVGLVALILLTLIGIMNFKTILKYLIGAVIGAALTFTVMKIFFCKAVETKTEYICEEGYELRDTCIGSNLLCTITSKDSINIYKIIKEGLKVQTTARPKIEEAVVVTEEGEDSYEETLYTDYLNTGQTEVWDTLVVSQNKIKSWKRAHKSKEVTEVQEKVTNNTAVIAEDKDDSKKIEYFPVETTSTWIGLQGSVLIDDKVKVPVGLTLDRGRNTFGIVKDVTTPFKSLKGYGATYKRDLIKVSSKQ